ncbi:MAG: hypothetical protein HQK95_02795 [Nitrospirae bacterium]|nr:hypothetical protein [Nitrospirota bacterium]
MNYTDRIYPTNKGLTTYLDELLSDINAIDNNSLLNIVYLTQITNLNISNKNPLEYIKQYDTPLFESIMSTHLLPQEILEWSRLNEMPSNALDIFKEKRLELLIESLRQKLQGCKIETVDTMPRQ